MALVKSTTIKDAIKIFEERKGVVATEVEKVEINGMCPPIEKMDATLSTLKGCRHLSLSTNNIEKISSLSGMENLKILSLGRNQIKKIENLDAIADTLEELWMSYNIVATLAGIEKLSALRVLFLSNNKLTSWAEIDRLAALDKLEDLLLAGNPLHLEYKNAGEEALLEYRIEVVKRLPNLKKLDGKPIEMEERDAALAARGG